MPDGASFCETDIAILTELASIGENLKKLGWDLSKPQEWYGIQWKYDDGMYYVEKLSLAASNLEGDIHISGLSKLKALDLSNNKIAALLVDNCPELVQISCVEAELENLEVSGCPMLTQVYGYYNYLKEETVGEIEKNYGKEGNILELSPQYLKGDREDFAEEEVKAILSFANLEENQSSISFDKDKPGSWDCVIWEKQKDGLYHIIGLEFESQWITGKLDISSLKYLKSFSFASTNLTEIVLPETIETIPLKAFYNCVLLEKVTIPNSVKEIKDLAFANCTGLKKIYFYSQNAQIGMNSFYHSNAIEQISCYADTTESSYCYDVQPQFMYWKPTEDTPEEEDQKEINQKENKETKEYTENKKENSSKKNVLKVGNKKTVGNAVYKITKISKTSKTVAYVTSKNKKAKTIVVPSTIVIDGMAFKVTAIEKNAFKNMKKLQKVTIGKYVKTIGEKAFYNCRKLKTIQIKSMVLKKIGKYTFKNINKQVVVKVPKAKKKTYTKMLKKKSTGLPKNAKIK